MNMRNRFVLWLVAVVAAGTVGCNTVWAQSEDGGSPAAPAVANPQFPWPSQFSADGQFFTVYPPELDRWDNDQLQGRVAMSVQTGNDAKPVYGVADFTARVQVDGATQLATVRDIRVAHINFPTAPQSTERYMEPLRAHFAALVWQLPAEQLRGALAVERTARETHGQPVRNDPPKIVYSDRPAILVSIDGQPVLRDLVGLGLKRVLNTRALILQDPESDRYFIYVAGRWLESRTLDGPWNDAQVRPSALDDAKQQAQASGQVDLLDADNRALGTTRVVVSTVPAELVQTDGAPQYAPVNRTQLLYVTNTSNRLFLDLSTQQYYVLLSGRWYRTRALDQGRWEYVAGAALPADFAMIPDGHPTATVRESVPGTPQAAEAAIANSVPQVATVKRTEAQLDLTYDGPPQFRAIEGTSLEYAVNAPIPVIRIDERSYYALDNGVWFFSVTVDGPWSPASYVPPVIYSIPRSSPLHYVTYVRVYSATPDYVSVGYSPGYVGSYVTTEQTVVYGSGWYYRPWIGTVWFGSPVTWGFGFSFWNTWWNPWPWRPWWAFRPVPCFHPWWGPWHGPVVVQATVVRPAVAAVPVARPAVAAQVNVTSIYRRWGPNVAVPHAASASPVPVALAPRAVPAPAAGASGGRPDWHVYRQRDGQWQRFVGNGQWEKSSPPPNGAARFTNDGATARVAPAQTLAPTTGTPPVITAPRRDPRAMAESSNGHPVASTPRPIVGPPPGIQPPTTGAANVVRNPPGSPVRPIVGPTPGMQTPDIQGTPGGNVQHSGRPLQPSAGRPVMVTPSASAPSTPGSAVRQRFEQHSPTSAPLHIAPVPASVAPSAYPHGRGDVGVGPQGSRPAMMTAPAANGRALGSSGGRGQGWHGDNHEGGRR